MALQRTRTEQGVFTVPTRIKPGRVDALRAVLRRIASELPPAVPAPRPDGLVPFAALTTVHFARWVLLDETLDPEGNVIAAELILATAYDEPLEAHLRELVTVARAGLDAIYEHCEGYPEGPARTPDAVADYLREHANSTGAVYVGTRGRSVDQIHEEAALHGVLEEALDGLADEPGRTRTPVEFVEELRTFVYRRSWLRWALDPPPRPSSRWLLAHYGRLVLIGLVLLALLPVLVPVLLVIVVPLRIAERRDAVEVGARGPVFVDATSAIAHLRELTRLEDVEIQNPMTLVVKVKPGRFRLVVLKAVLRFAQLRASYIDTKGTLVGIPSIHFAHWNVIDEGRRLLFFSNYDGTWESYLGDFIDRAGDALTAIWSNTMHFPPTRFLVLGGARDEQRFKEWVRRYQSPTDVWYSAYPRLSVQNIDNSSALRAGLSATNPSPADLARWLQRL